MKNSRTLKGLLCPFKSFSLLTIFLLSTYFAQAFHITYTVDQTSGCKDLVVAFTNTTVDTTGKIYIWDYQDGTNKDTSYHATHTFTTPGTYTVILTQDSAGTTFNSLGNGSTITVNGSSGIFYSSPTTACPDQSVSFYSNDNYTSLNWNFGDGSQNETWNWVSHSYSDTGTYVVTLIVNHSCGIDTITQNYVVSNSIIPLVTIQVDEDSVCALDDIH
ncbi:MAG: PKD domain-containing protein, partial [Bacteroidia bacterium]|nr:PKD domain-containing protein [Bacteroidia bacterium]